MARYHQYATAGAVAVAALLAIEPADAAQQQCIFDWAVPGEYTISGNVGGRVESATALLSPACRVFFRIPGVYSGGQVQEAGSCLKFGFKVDGAPRAFTAQWCDDHAVLPWQGKEIPVKVTPVLRR